MVSIADEEQTPKDLASLEDDPAFREFFKLQEGFEWNGKEAPKSVALQLLRGLGTVAIRVISCLERLLGKGSSRIL